jgi:ABC-2 type transport system permease protein
VSVVGQFGWVTRRSIVGSLRRPEAIAPSFVFPLVLLAVTAAGMRRFAEAPGFPADSYLDFALGGALIQAALVGAVTSGASLAGDVESGFLSRLALTPVPRSVLLFGHFAGTALLAGLAGVVYLTIGRLLGVEIHTGILGAVVVVGLAVLVALAFGAICSALALLTGSSEAIQGMFPLFFTLLSISTFFTPRAFIGAGWFRRVATVNPVSYLIDGARSLVIASWDTTAILRAVGISAAIALVATTGAVAALHHRLEVR